MHNLEQSSTRLLEVYPDDNELIYVMDLANQHLTGPNEIGGIDYDSAIEYIDHAVTLLPWHNPERALNFFERVIDSAADHPDIADSVAISLESIVSIDPSRSIRIWAKALTSQNRNVVEQTLLTYGERHEEINAVLPNFADLVNTEIAKEGSEIPGLPSLTAQSEPNNVAEEKRSHERSSDVWEEYPYEYYEYYEAGAGFDAVLREAIRQDFREANLMPIEPNE